MDRGQITGLAAGVLVGAAIGAGLGLLYAPQSGRKTRKELQRQALEMKERTDDLVSKIKERDEEFCRAIKQGAEDYRREILAKAG